MSARRRLKAGDHSPKFSCPDSDGGLFDLHTDITGQPVVMIFTGGRPLADLASGPLDADALDPAQMQVVTVVPGDAARATAEKRAAGWPHRTVADPDGEITDGFRNLSDVPPPSVYVLDPNQRIAGIAGVEAVGSDLPGWIRDRVREARYDDAPTVVSRGAPVLLLPRALDPDECDWLIGLWRDGERQQGLVTLGATAATRHAVDTVLKRREDFVIQDQAVVDRIIECLMPRLVPEVSKILHFEDWGIEAFRIGCYTADDAGFFGIHRDDSNPSVKHRKFALTLNLNTGDYAGGDLRFPEYGPELYRPPKGGAVVFSCSMLHEVVPVTSGARFVLLTFLTEPTGTGR